MPRGSVPFPFGCCRVCNAQATGNHYGANTCEGCKGFFKRSLGKSEKYKCLNNEKCAIDPENRIKCKLCRFKRCLALGMSMEAIKMGRIPKVQKQKALEGKPERASERVGIVSVSKDLCRSNSLQPSPTSSEEIAVPPHHKHRKLSEPTVQPSPTVHPSPQPRQDIHQGSHLQQKIYDGYHGQVSDAGNLYDTHPKPSSAEMREDLHDNMVQLLNDVISLNEWRECQDQVDSARSVPHPTDYARSLATISSNFYSPGVNYDHWYPSAQPGYQHAEKLHSCQPFPHKNGYPNSEHVYSEHPTSPYDISPTHRSSDHQLDVFMEMNKSANNIRLAASSKLTNSSISSQHFIPHPNGMAHTPTSPPHDMSSNSTNSVNSVNNGYQTSNSNVEDSQMSYGLPDGYSPPYASYNANSLQADIGYKYDIRPRQYHNPNQGQELHSDYDSIDKLSSSSSPASLLTSEADYEILIKSVTSAYWEVTTDVRESVNVMEDIIATGSTDRMLPFSLDNYPILWKWLMEAVSSYNDKMTKFFLKCPLMSAICPDDKAVLLKHCYISVWLVWNSPLFKNGQTYIPFSNNKFVYTRVWMEKILPADFVAYLYEYAARQNSARFSINEISLLCGLALTPSNVEGVKNAKLVDQIHREYSKALTYEICKSRVNSKEMLSEIEQLLKYLETAVAKQEIILNFKEQSPPAQTRQRASNVRH